MGAGEEGCRRGQCAPARRRATAGCHDGREASGRVRDSGRLPCSSLKDQLQVWARGVGLREGPASVSLGPSGTLELTSLCRQGHFQVLPVSMLTIENLLLYDTSSSSVGCFSPFLPLMEPGPGSLPAFLGSWSLLPLAHPTGAPPFTLEDPTQAPCQWLLPTGRVLQWHQTHHSGRQHTVGVFRHFVLNIQGHSSHGECPDGLVSLRLEPP